MASTSSIPMPSAEDHHNMMMSTTLHHYDHLLLHQTSSTPTTTMTKRDHPQIPRKSSGSATGGRRKHPPAAAASSTKEKKPQRGMGVEKLERMIRLQSEIKNNPQQAPSTPPAAQSSSSPLPFAVINPTASSVAAQDSPISLNMSSSVPMHLVAKFGSPVYPLNLNQQQAAAAVLVQRLGNSNNITTNMGLFQQAGHDEGQLVFSDHDKFPASGNQYLYGVEKGDHDQNRRINKLELSSTPSLRSSSPDRCNACLKKKRPAAATGENHVVFKGSVLKDMNIARGMPSNITTSDIAGLNLANRPYNNYSMASNQYFGRNSSSFRAAGTYSAGNVVDHQVQGTHVDVVAVSQRKASSYSRSTKGSGRLFYEFFPSGVGVMMSRSESDDQNEDQLMMRMMVKEVVDGSSESSSWPVIGGTTVVDGSSSIDLSLRLSH